MSSIDGKRFTRARTLSGNDSRSESVPHAGVHNLLTPWSMQQVYSLGADSFYDFSQLT